MNAREACSVSPPKIRGGIMGAPKPAKEARARHPSAAYEAQLDDIELQAHSNTRVWHRRCG